MGAAAPNELVEVQFEDVTAASTRIDLLEQILNLHGLKRERAADANPAEQIDS